MFSPSAPITWQVDQKGYVTRITRGPTIPQPVPEHDVMRTYDVGDLIAKAKCLSG